MIKTDFSRIIPPAWFAQRTALVRYLPTPRGLGRVVLACVERHCDVALIGLHRLPAGRESGEVRDGDGGYGITCCLQGAGILRQRNGEEEPFSAPCLLRLAHVTPGTLSWQPGPVRECFLNIDSSTGDHLHGLGLWPQQQRRMVLDDPRPLLRAFTTCYHLALEADPAPGLLLLRCLELLHLSNAHLDDQQDERWLARACQLIEQGVERGSPLADVARRLGICERHFRRRFQRLSGRSPQAHRQGLVMHRALRLLADHSVAEVADLLGYSEAAAFSRQFRRHVGRPPNHYRPGGGG